MERLRKVLDHVMIESMALDIYKQLVEEKVFVPSPHGMVRMNVYTIHNILKALIESKYMGRVLEASQDSDLLADLKILLWEIKKEKEK